MRDRDDNIEIIPINPPVGGTLYRHTRAIEASSTNIRERSGEKLVIPAWPPKPVAVPVTPPVQRRQFTAPVGYAQRRTRKED